MWQQKLFSKHILPIKFLGTSWKTALNIGSDNGLVPDGTKPLPEPMMAQMYILIRHH